MPSFFDPTPAALAELDALADQIPGIQETLVRNNKQLQRPDRGAHEQQLAASKVTLRIADQIPDELAGLGVFSRDAQSYTGIGRISTGLGCPHIQTNPDFLGIMLAFRTAHGQRIDFIGINDPTSPTDTAPEFVALLGATGDAAGAEIPFGGQLGDLAASDAVLLNSLRKRLGLIEGLKIFEHVGTQTARTAISSTAYQPYWTGIVRANNTLGKFTLVPTEDVNRTRAASPGEKYLSLDWKTRQSQGDLTFRLEWIPFVSDALTPLDKLTTAWQAPAVQVGTVVFPQTDPETRDAKLVALLASEMGANPGNWVSRKDAEQPEIPGTEFTAARAVIYRKSQAGRNVLPEALYEPFFNTGVIGPELATELIRRYQNKRGAGHDVPDIGDLQNEAGQGA